MNQTTNLREMPSTDSVDVRKLSRRLAVGQAWLGAGLLLTIPLFDFFRPTRFPWHATLHAFSAISMVVLGGYAGHHAIYLLRGATQRIPAIRRLSHWCAGFAALTIASGNWAYMPYRGDGGARQRLLATSPFFHSVLMEFKEFICLLPLPLYVAAAFLLWHYDTQTARDNGVASAVGILLIAAWTFLITGAVAGISIAKVQFL